jgi:hypothetical protein
LEIAKMRLSRALKWIAPALLAPVIGTSLHHYFPSIWQITAIAEGLLAIAVIMWVVLSLDQKNVGGFVRQVSLVFVLAVFSITWICFSIHR